MVYAGQLLCSAAQSAGSLLYCLDVQQPCIRSREDLLNGLAESGGLLGVGPLYEITEQERESTSATGLERSLSIAQCRQVGDGKGGQDFLRDRRPIRIIETSPSLSSHSAALAVPRRLKVDHRPRGLLRPGIQGENLEKLSLLRLGQLIENERNSDRLKAAAPIISPSEVVISKPQIVADRSDRSETVTNRFEEVCLSYIVATDDNIEARPQPNREFVEVAEVLDFDLSQVHQCEQSAYVASGVMATDRREPYLVCPGRRMIGAKI